MLEVFTYGKENNNVYFKFDYNIKENFNAI